MGNKSEVSNLVGEFLQLHVSTEVQRAERDAWQSVWALLELAIEASEPVVASALMLQTLQSSDPAVFRTG